MGRNEDSRRNAEAIIQCFTQLTASSTWQCVGEIRLAFRTYHPQGLVKSGDYFYVSSVEKLVPTEKFESPQNGYDRSPGEGVGHLFKFDSNGKLVSKIHLGEGTVYHPGGIDFDVQDIWIPVAEYRPNSQSIIYRVNPETLEANKVFRFEEDHIGAIAYNRWDDTLHGVSWGGRKFYTWKLDGEKTWTNLKGLPDFNMHMNGSHYIDYQDCHFLEEKYMLYSGLNAYSIPNIGRIHLGGLELVDLELQLAVHQIPVNLYTHTMRPMTQNPFSVDLHQDHLRFYFLPDDDESILYVYDVLN